MNTRRVTRRSSTIIPNKNSLCAVKSKPTAANRQQQKEVKRTHPNSELNAKQGQKLRAAFGDLTNNFKLPKFQPSKNKATSSECPVTKKVETDCTLIPNPPSFKKQIEPIEEEPVIVQLSLALEPITIDDSGEGSDLNLTEEIDFDAFDKEHSAVAFWETEYAKDIFDYYRKQERVFVVPDYMTAKQTDVTADMRMILVDWMVEVHSNFELHHETLYVAVKLVDMFLSKVCIRRSILQLVGTAALFIACKYEEQILPQCDDFLYVSDNAYDVDELFEMERRIFDVVDYCLGFPLSYRFLRRYSNVSGQNTVTLTLARYILESSLLDYQFCYEKESLKAAASLWLSLRMTNKGWDAMLAHHSGYCESDLIDLAVKLNTTLLNTSRNSTNEVQGKYSHCVFFQVAQIPKLSMEQLKCERR